MHEQLFSNTFAHKLFPNTEDGVPRCLSARLLPAATWMHGQWVVKKQRAGEPELVVIVRPNPPKHTCINVLPELPVYIYSSCQFLLKITWLQNQEYQYKYKNMFCYTWSRIHWAHTCCLSVSSCQPPPRSGVFEDMSKMTSTWSCCLSRAKVP